MTEPVDIAPTTELGGTARGVHFAVTPAGLAVVTLARPDRHNCFDDQMIERLSEIFDDIARQNGIRALILRADGTSFSAGGDIEWMRRQGAQPYADNLADARALALMFKRLDRLPVPSLALVDGAAFGGGVGLAACCDIVLCTPRASFCLSEVKIGLMPATVLPYAARALGARQARRYAMTAERIDAHLAMRLGLVHELLDDAAAMEHRADQLVDLLFRNAPGAMTEGKALVHDIVGCVIDDELIDVTAAAIARRRTTAEAREGFAAFLDKRPPAWAP